MMAVMDDDVVEVVGNELSLLRPAVRSSPADVLGLLDTDFRIRSVS